MSDGGALAMVQCGWTDTDYGPYGIRGQRCVYLDYNNANYNAHLGAPASYVRAKWNDSFTAAQGCVGDPA